MSDVEARSDRLVQKARPRGIAERQYSVPPQVREMGGQIFGKMMGDGNGEKSDQAVTVEQVAALMPKVMAVVERTLDVDKLKKQSVAQVLDKLEAQAAQGDRPIVAQARAALALLPILAEANFEDVYLRYMEK